MTWPRCSYCFGLLLPLWGFGPFAHRRCAVVYWRAVKNEQEIQQERKGTA